MRNILVTVILIAANFWVGWETWGGPEFSEPGEDLPEHIGYAIGSVLPALGLSAVLALIGLGIAKARKKPFHYLGGLNWVYLVVTFILVGSTIARLAGVDA
jgi:hypothetical protein